MHEEMGFGKLMLAALAAMVLFVGMFVVTMPAFAEFYGAGNIDLDARVVVENEDGSFSTEISFSTEFDGLQYLLPTVINGEVVSEDEAIEHFLETGEYLGCFETVVECDQYAEWLHCRQEAVYGAGH